MGKEIVHWHTLDDDVRKVELRVAMQDTTVPARLLAMHAIPEGGLDDDTRAALALKDEALCVQPYKAVVAELSEEHITAVQRPMKCVRVDMQTLEGLEDYHQLATTQEIQKVANGEGAKVIGGKPMLLGANATMHLGWKRHVKQVARAAGFVEKVQDRANKQKQPSEQEDERDLCIQRLLDEQTDLLAEIEKLRRPGETTQSRKIGGKGRQR